MPGGEDYDGGLVATTFHRDSCLPGAANNPGFADTALGPIFRAEHAPSGLHSSCPPPRRATSLKRIKAFLGRTGAGGVELADAVYGHALRAYRGGA